MFREFRLLFLLCLFSPIARCQLFAQSDSRANALSLEQQGRAAEAEAAWKTIAEANPNSAEAFAHLGLLEARQEHFADAIDNYRKALALAPAMPGLEMNLGLAYFKASQFPDAIKMFSAEIEKHPADGPDAQRLTILLGMSHYGMGDYFVAIPYLRRAGDTIRKACRCGWRWRTAACGASSMSVC